MKFVLPLLIAIQLLIPAACFAHLQVKEWSYPEKKTIWHEALGPHNNDALAVIEGRTFIFKSTQDQRGAEYDANLTVFQDAVRLSKSHVKESPSDYIHCLVNLSVFYYLRGEMGPAENFIDEAIKVAADNSNQSSLNVSEIAEYRSVMKRALGGFRTNSESTKKNYESAERHFNYILKSRQDLLSAQHPDIGHTKSHQLMTYLDGDNYQKAYYAGEDPDVSLLKPFMPNISTEDIFSKMLRFAEAMKFKYTPQIIEEEGIGSIIGNWNVAQDVTVTVKHSTKEESKEIAGEIHELRSGSGVQQSRISDVPIYLCRISDHKTLTASIKAFGARRGLLSKDFPGKWPVTHQQAEDLLLGLQRQVENLGKKTKTDKDGGFDFPNVAKGKYFLFASLANKEQCRLWFKQKDDEGNDLDIQTRKQFEVSFEENDGIVIWSRERKRGQFPQFKHSGFIPPPPPIQLNNSIIQKPQY